jgi:hypothetical protein
MKKGSKMFKVTITDEMSETIVLSVDNAKALLKLIKEYTSVKSLDSTPIYSILTELDEEYYNNRGFDMG